MTRHVSRTVLDTIGIELPDATAAYSEALARIRSILEAEAVGGSINLARQIDVTDADGRRIFSIPYSAALD